MSALDLDEVLSIVASPGWNAAKRLGAAGWKTAEALAILARREREVANRACAKIASMRREINALGTALEAMTTRAHEAEAEVLPRIEELELALEEAQADALTRETELLEQLALATESATAAIAEPAPSPTFIQCDACGYDVEPGDMLEADVEPDIQRGHKACMYFMGAPVPEEPSP